MPRTPWLDRLIAALTVVALATAAAAQPPAGGPPPDPLREALDADGDHALSADEVENAAQAVAALDRDKNGRIDHEEFRPPRPPAGPGGFPEGRPFRGDRAAGRPPREGRRPFGDGEAGRPSPERFVERAMAFDADGDGKLDRKELEKFADEMRRRMLEGRPEGGPRPERPRRPE